MNQLKTHNDKPRSHWEIIQQFKSILQDYGAGKVDIPAVARFVFEARKETSIARSALASTAREYPELHKVIQNSEEYLEKQENIKQPTLSELYQTPKLFTEEDADLIVERIAKNPYIIYEALTNKIRDYDKEKLAEDKNTIRQQLLDFAVSTMKLDNISEFFTTLKGKQTIVIKNDDERFVRVKFYSQTIATNNIDNWFYVSLNKIDDSGERWIVDETTMRIYIHPKIEFWFEVYGDLIKQLVNSTQLQETGFESKAAEFFRSHDWAPCLNQDDRCIFYIPKESEEEAYNLILNYHNQHPEKFEPAQTLAQNVPGTTGISISSDPKKRSFNQIHELIITKIIAEFKKMHNMEYDFNEKLQANASVRKLLKEFLVKQYPEEALKSGLSTHSIAFMADKNHLTS